MNKALSENHTTPIKIFNDFRYDIRLFNWDKEIRTFSADASDLYVANYAYCFPNVRRQFFIENTKTKGFRRFRLVVESFDSWIFRSEDKILCIIYKGVTTTQ
jgi:hypothetical protein